MSRIGFPIALALIVWVVFHVVGIRSTASSATGSRSSPPGLPKGMISRSSSSS